VAVLVLVVAGISGTTVAIHIAIVLKRAVNFRSLIIGMYLLVFVASGIVHVGVLGGTNRGYVDLLAVSNRDTLSLPIWATALGLAALCLGTLRSLRRDPKQGYPSRNLAQLPKLGLFWSAILLLPPTLFALTQMNAFAESAVSDRIISLDGGMARFGFLSQWFTWAVSFLALWLVSTKCGRSVWRIALLLLGSIAAIVLSLSWTGGRAIALMMCLPLILTFWPLLGRIRVLLAIGLAVTGALYSAAITTARTANYSLSDFGVGSAVDWELGRFSMMGFAQNYVEQNGLLWGETLAAGILSVPFGILKILGLGGGLDLPRSITEVSGQSILGSSSLTYVVPGMGAELYVNFGLVGTCLGFYLLGRAVSIVDGRFAAAEFIPLKFALAYVGVLLIFCTISSQSGAIFNYAFFTGLPVMIMLAVIRRGRLAMPGIDSPEALAAPYRESVSDLGSPTSNASHLIVKNRK